MPQVEEVYLQSKIDLEDDEIDEVFDSSSREGATKTRSGAITSHSAASGSASARARHTGTVAKGRLPAPSHLGTLDSVAIRGANLTVPTASRASKGRTRSMTRSRSAQATHGRIPVGNSSPAPGQHSLPSQIFDPRTISPFSQPSSSLPPSGSEVYPTGHDSPGRATLSPHLHFPEQPSLDDAESRANLFGTQMTSGHHETRLTTSAFHYRSSPDSWAHRRSASDTPSSGKSSSPGPSSSRPFSQAAASAVLVQQPALDRFAENTRVQRVAGGRSIVPLATAPSHRYPSGPGTSSPSSAYYASPVPSPWDQGQLSLTSDSPAPDTEASTLSAPHTPTRKRGREEVQPRHRSDHSRRRL